MYTFLVIHIDFVSYWMKNQRKLNVCALEGEKICNVQGFDKTQESPLARKDITPQVRFTVQQVLQCMALIAFKTICWGSKQPKYPPLHCMAIK